MLSLVTGGLRLSVGRRWHVHEDAYPEKALETHILQLLPR
jgi:hypothetical protein